MIKDCKRIQTSFLQHGYIISLETAQTIWEEISEKYAAGWIGLPKDNTDLWIILESKMNLDISKYSRYMFS